MAILVAYRGGRIVCCYDTRTESAVAPPQGLIPYEGDGIHIEADSSVRSLTGLGAFRALKFLAEILENDGANFKLKLELYSKSVAPEKQFPLAFKSGDKLIVFDGNRWWSTDGYIGPTIAELGDFYGLCGLADPAQFASLSADTLSKAFTEIFSSIIREEVTHPAFVTSPIIDELCKRATYADPANTTVRELSTANPDCQPVLLVRSNRGVFCWSQAGWQRYVGPEILAMDAVSVQKYNMTLQVVPHKSGELTDAAFLDFESTFLPRPSTGATGGGHTLSISHHSLGITCGITYQQSTKSWKVVKNMSEHTTEGHKATTGLGTVVSSSLSNVNITVEELIALFSGLPRAFEDFAAEIKPQANALLKSWNLPDMDMFIRCLPDSAFTLNHGEIVKFSIDPDIMLEVELVRDGQAYAYGRATGEWCRLGAVSEDYIRYGKMWNYSLYSRQEYMSCTVNLTPDAFVKFVAKALDQLAVFESEALRTYVALCHGGNVRRS